MSKQKLELTWVGKNVRPQLEPRILLEDESKSHSAKHRVTESDIFDNSLIFGDNLLALKALEQDYAGKVKCVYIDPPFNTGEAFEHYEDGLEHSTWLDLMAQRLRLIWKLLAPEGTLFIHIDDNELGYLIVLCDEIFGRSNRINIITFKQSSASGPKAINPGLVTTANYLVFYAKDKSLWRPNRVYQAVSRDDRYGSFIENIEEHFAGWRICTLREAFSRHHRATWTEVRQRFAERLEDEITKFVLKNRNSVVQLASVRDKDINEDARAALQKSRETTGLTTCSARADKEDYYFLNGKQLLFYRNKVKRISGIETSALAASNIWDDLLSNNVHQEGGVSFPNGKKPEALLERILSFATNTGDLVLDSFAGSGTTGAVAHKMGRRWIMVELGEHCETHVRPRLMRVIDGDDREGVSSSVGWKGGGGFRYFRLAPTLLRKDRWGQWVVNKDYNPEMLAAAICKLEGFTYAPSADFYWQHGYSTETDFIYVTTQSLNAEQLQGVSEEVGPERTLLVCCGAFRGDVSRYPNLTVKKIPKMVLKKCEWGHDDYSLNVDNLPQAPKPAMVTTPQSGLFDDAGGAK